MGPSREGRGVEGSLRTGSGRGAGLKEGRRSAVGLRSLDGRVPAAARLVVGDDPRLRREQGVVPALADALAGMDPGPALTHDDRAGGHLLTAEHLDAEPLGLGVSPVAGRTAALLVSHRASEPTRGFAGGSRYSAASAAPDSVLSSLAGFVARFVVGLGSDVVAAVRL